MSSPLIILDRDGVINHDSDAYIRSPEDWTPIAGSIAAIAQLNRAGYKVGVATNQSGLSRGFFDLTTLEDIHDKMYRLLAESDAHIDQLVFCPDHPDSPGPDRKPAPGMALKLLSEFNAIPCETWFVGDSLSDIKCALNAGCKPALVLTGKGIKTLETAEFKALVAVPVYSSLAEFTKELLTGN